LQEARRITQQSETALIFDEVINGFRIHLNGAQAFYGVQSDLGTWGKIIGGGMPIGALTGSAKYMDALDGGHWQYGDDSFPEVGVTFFAGTYIRHPLAMAASRAILTHLKQHGPGLQQQLGERTAAMVDEINAFAKDRGIPLHIERCASLFYFHFPADVPHGSLLWFHLREKGLHIWEGRPCFLSTAHTDDDVREIVRIFKDSLLEMQQGGFLPGAEIELVSEPVRAAEPVAQSTQVVEKTAPVVFTPTPIRCQRPLDFSIYFFGNYPAEYREGKYDLILEAARFADAHGFKAIWLPERHFHAVGGFSPNPSLLAAALARETKQLQLRAGSVVLPLHHPVRVAEEWAMVDNLSGGRTGMSIASGWHPNDFIFAPGSFEKRRELNLENLGIIQKLWRGEKVNFPTGGVETLDVALHPMPKQRELPVWLTSIHKDSFIKAGELGIGVLAYLMNQTLDEVGEKIAAYREAFARAGHDPAKAHVTILLHTFVGEDTAGARRMARGPLREYLRSFLDNSQKRIEAGGGEVAMDAEDMEYLLDRAFEDYSTGKAFIGSPESCLEVAQKLTGLGVDEIGCFLDFGVEPKAVLEHLPQLVKLKDLLAAPSPQEPLTLPLTPAQAGLRMLHEMGGEAARTYLESCTLELRGALNLPALQSAFDQLIQRHEALRTSMSADGQTQTIHPVAELLLEIEDISANPTRERLRALGEDFESTVLDLTHAPLFDAKLVKTGAEQHQLFLRFHHLLGNGPSYWIFFEELCALYEAANTGSPAALETPLQLRDYVRWREASRQSAQESADEAFWLEHFSGELAELELPADHPRPARMSFRGARVRHALDAELTTALRKAGAKERGSLFMMLFTAWQTLLHRLSGQQDFVVATPFESSVRELPGGPQLFANTTNLVPLRVQTGENMSFAELLAQTKSGVLAASEHQEHFFGQLLGKLGIKPDPSRSPLFNTLFNYETGTFARTAAGVQFTLVTEDAPYRNPQGTAMFDLGVNVAEQNGALLVECDYNSDLFETETIARWLRHFETLLRAIAEDPQQPLQTLPLLGEPDQQLVLETWNRTQRDYPTDVLLHELFELQVQKTPDATALIFERQRVSYRALNERANRLAHTLRNSGVAADGVVAILAERSIEMVVALLATLKAGGAYLPLDPGHPRERLAFMLRDASPTLTLVQAKFATLLPDTKTLTLENNFAEAPAENLSRQTEPDHLAYVIYTSGSTGQPKGAMNTHRGIVNRLLWMQKTYQLTASDRVLQKTPYTFDVSVWELFWPLLAGASLVIAKPGLHGDSGYLLETIRAHSVTTMHFVPPMLAAFLEDPNVGDCRTLRRVICSGEALSAAVQNQFFSVLPGVELHNLYGPTEAAVDVTFWACKPQGKATSVPIGRPVANTQIYLLDAALKPVPIGIAGELHIGGVQLARGYLGQPELTAEKFIANPFGTGRLYKTGDLARWRTDGAIEYLGRLDHQVKLRGFRIELGEIEAVLKPLPQIRDCVVLLREQRLVAYVLGTGISANELRTHAQTKLPEYMVPSAFVALERWPLTANGKLDRRALPEPEITTTPTIEPQSELEQKLSAIWRDVLEIDALGTSDNFFELGGDSLSGLRVVNRLRELTGEHVSLVTMFEAPTIAQLARLLEQNYLNNGALKKTGSQATVTTEMVSEFRGIIGSADPLTVAPQPKLERAIFILSPMRSGSTLTRIMLSAHPQLFAPPELQLLQFETLAQRQQTFHGYERYMLEGTLRALMEIHHCTLEEAQAEMSALEAKTSVPDFYRVLQSAAAPRILVDKTPDYAMQPEVLERAESWFENAFYIHLVRHPLGMMRSFERGHFILESPYRGRHNFAERDLAEMTWQISHENILQFLSHIPSSRQHRLSFESLVQAPQPALQALCAALGLDFDAAMLDPYGRGEMTDGVHPMAQQVGDHEFAKHRKLQSETADAWRSDYSEELLSARTLEIARQLGCLETASTKGQLEAIPRVARDAHRQKRSLLPS
jgi:amino acid adenylation domain-containing protein/natural product biosynthesis luciferase-like monooxygenase protein